MNACCSPVVHGLVVLLCFSPCPEQGMGDEFNLMDHSDLYILDFSESDFSASLS